MFDSIAPAYDFMNGTMTFGIHRLWRNRTVGEVRKLRPAEIIDIATGTGDLAIAMARRLPQAHITGIDLSEKMLEIARRKSAAARLERPIDFICADCLSLPLADNSAAVITAAYGVRNFADISAGYREMLRVLQPGGTLAVLELSTPSGPITGPLYRFYTRRIIPVAGRLVSKDARAYSYLQESVAVVPQGDAMLRLMQEAGFTNTRMRSFTFGTCTLYIGQKPSQPGNNSSQEK